MTIIYGRTVVQIEIIAKIRHSYYLTRFDLQILGIFAVFVVLTKISSPLHAYDMKNLPFYYSTYLGI